VNLGALLSDTCAELSERLAYSGQIDSLRADDCAVAPDMAALLALFVREAVTNAIKLAHPAGVQGKIAIACRLDPKGTIIIEVTDDGVGLPEKFNTAADGKTGFRIMRAVSDRLAGTLVFKSTSLGLQVRLRVPYRPLAVARRARSARLPDAQLLEALPAAIYMTDAEGRLTFYNEAAEALWGHRPELGKTEYCGSWRLYDQDAKPMPHDQCPMALTLKEQGPIRGMEAVAERPDGTRVPFVPYPTPLFDKAGTLVGAVNMLVDISDRKQAETSLAKHRDEQAALYEFTDRLFRAASPTDVYDAALDAIRRALGCERASILLFDAKGVMRFSAWRGLSERYRCVVEGHSPWTRDTRDPQPICIADIESCDLSEELKATVKSEGIGALAFIPLVAKGELVGKFMTYYSARHEFVDRELHLALTIARQLGFSLERMRGDETGRLLASIIETSDDAILSKDLNGIITSWNRGAERVFGYTAEEMVGKPIMMLIPADRHDEEREILAKMRRGEHVEHYETVRQRKDGSLVDISLAVSPVKDATGRVVGASKIARDITERRQAEARQEFLTREIQHRTKNLFAVVQAVVARSFAGKHTVKDAEVAVMNRLRSLAQTHVMLIDKEWQGADLAEVVRVEMKPYADRVHIEGPSLVLTAKAAQNFALALHELATNAAKYGALSNTRGRVHIGWSVTRSKGSGSFSFRWQERGGPPVSAPAHKGFGSAVLEQVMGEYFDAPPRVDYAVGGVSYELSGSLDAVMPDAHPAARGEAAGVPA
jgi:PAS domain S-box-containing protein